MNEIIEVLKTRRSCRGYKPEQITEEQLKAILDAGVYAPTGMGRQSPLILAVQDKKTRDELSEMNAAVMGSSSDPFYGAPTVLVVLADKSYPTYRDDGNMVIANLLNAAHAVGVDSCYIYRAREVFNTEKGKKLLESLDVTGEYEGIGNVILGYGLEGSKKQPEPRKEGYVIRV